MNLRPRSVSNKSFIFVETKAAPNTVQEKGNSYYPLNGFAISLNIVRI